MADNTKLWAKIQADFRLGASLGNLRKKYKVSVAQIIKRAKAEGWTRAKDEPKVINGKALAVIIESAAKTDQARKVDEAVDEALASVMKDHRRITRGLRDLFEDNVAEFQAMLKHFVTFMDEEQIEKLKLEAARSGDIKELVQYLHNAMTAFGKRTALLDRLVVIGGAVIEKERLVWGMKDYDGETGADWDELVEKLKEPIEIPILPAEILNFEKRIS